MTALREGGRLRALAVLGSVGLADRWLEARWPDEIAVLEAVVAEVEAYEAERIHSLSRAIRNEVVDAFPSK